MYNIFVNGWGVLVLAPFIGSWLGVVVGQASAAGGAPKSLWRRSACESCGHVLGPADLVPLVSFAVLRGRCRTCSARIGWLAPAIEVAAFAVAAAALAADGLAARAWVDAGLGWALLAAAWIDARTMILPDTITLPLILAGLAATAVFDPAALTDHAAATVLGYLAFRLLAVGYRALRGRDGLGAGDAKLLGAAGAWLGVAALPGVVLLAAFLGIIGIVGRGMFDRGRLAQPAPFGPALALALFSLRLAGWGS